MRGLVLALVLAPFGASADDVRLALSVSGAEIYPSGALVAAEASVELPAGAHRVELLMPREVLGEGVVAPEVSGAVVRGTEIAANVAYDPALFDLPVQAAARAALAEAEALEREAARKVNAQLAKIAALEAAADFMRGMDGGEALPDPARAAEMAATIAVELSRLAMDRAGLEAALPALREAQREAAEAGRRASGALDALFAPDNAWLLVTLDIVSEAEGPVTVRQEYFDFGAGWQVQYDATLTEAGHVALARSVALGKGQGLPWVDAALTLSTAQPTGQTDATRVSLSMARIFEAQPKAVQRSFGGQLDAPMMESAAILETVDGFVAANFDGPLVSYTLPNPVTVTGEEGARIVALGPLEFEAERYLAAAPRFDETAFIMADFENTSGETILPGAVQLFREETLVGESMLPLIAAGDEATLGFGPEISVVLDVAFLDQQEGDRGIIRGQETREDAIRLSARNLSAEAQVVRLRYAVPTSQQEDLEVRVDMAPSPTRRDVEDLKGVMEWELTLAPGQGQEIALDFDLRWPEGQTLNWRP